MNSDASKKLVIFGAGGHATSSLEVAFSAGYDVKYFIDSTKKNSLLFNIPVVSEWTEIDNVANYSYFIAIGDNAAREKVLTGIRSKYPESVFPPLVHRTAVISRYSNIGEGTIVMPNVVVGSNTKIGNFCILNTTSSIDHDSSMADFSSLAPGVVTGGKVKIGIRSAVSIGAVLKHGISIGNDSILGANSYLNKNLSDKQIAYGIPAKFIRYREFDEPYLN